VRLMTEEKKWSKIASDIHRDRAWYRGLRPTLYTALPGSCMWWPLYETIKSTLTPHTPYTVAAVGGSLSASFLTTLILHPIDTAKTRIQSGRGTFGEVGVLRLLKSMIRNEGTRSAYRGLVPRLLLSQCEGLLWGASYETIIAFSRRRDDDPT